MVDQFELEDTTEIAVNDNAVGGLLKTLIVVLVAICLFYFVTELTPPLQDNGKAPTGVTINESP